MKKKHFLASDFVPFIVCWLPSLVNYRPKMTTLLSWRDVKGIGVKESNVFKELVMTLLASTGVFHKKNDIIFDFLSDFTFFL